MDHQELNIKAQNLKYHCCTCLNKLNGHKYEVDDLTLSLSAIFEQCTGYSDVQNDQYPNCICDSCYEKLVLIDGFQKTSKKSMQFLKELLKPFEAEPILATAVYGKPSECEENEICSNVENEMLRLKKSKLNVENHDFDDPLLCNSTFEHISIKPEIIDENYELSDCKDSFNEYLSNETATAITDEENGSSNNLLSQDINKRCFQCKMCELGFEKKHQLKYHVRKSHKDKSNTKIMCKFGCEKSFRQAQAAEKHYKQMHQSTSELNKNEEKAVFKKGVASPEVLLLKKKIKEKLQELGCSLKVETNLQDMGEHEKDESIATSTSKPSCPICLKTFVSVSGVNVHMRTHLDERPFQCDKCERGFNKRALLTNHLREAHSEVPIEIVCKYGCGRVFHRTDTATNHYRLKHVLPAKGIKRDYKRICEECGKVFKNITILREHQFIHLPPEQRPYACDQCNKRFSMKKCLTEHLARHAGIKNFKCTTCGLRTVTRRELRLHMNIHTQARIYACSLCPKAFNNCGNLKRHEEVVHQGLKKYTCRYCNESFGKPDTLKHHEMRHTGERPHKCKTCDKAFIQLVALKAHMKTHNKPSKFAVQDTSDIM